MTLRLCLVGLMNAVRVTQRFGKGLTIFTGVVSMFYMFIFLTAESARTATARALCFLPGARTRPCRAAVLGCV